MTPDEQGTYKFSHDFKGRISDSSQKQNVLSFNASQKKTNEAIVTNGKAYRSILEDALDYKLIRIKTSRLVITKRNDGSKSYYAFTSSFVNDASGQDTTKRFMQFISDNLTNDLNLTATKGEI